MDLEPIRKSVGYLIRIMYPGALFLLIWNSRDMQVLSRIEMAKVESSQIVPYAVIVYVCGTIVYLVCRALVFDLLLNRWRNRWWEHDLNPDTESRAFYRRFEYKKEDLADFLNVRFGLCNAQIQTCFLFLLSPLIGVKNSIWRDCRFLVPMIAIVVVLIISAIRQLKTLWRIEKILVNGLPPQ